jgi:hypothetical protein
MTLRKVQDLEGAKVINLNYNSSAGAIAAVIKRMFFITCYTEQDTRLRLDPALTTGIVAGTRTTRAKKILIYDAHARPLSDLDPSNCRPGITIRDKSVWVINTLKVIEQFPADITPDQDAAHVT